METVSVIIPVYNGAQTIVRTLDSVFAQEGVNLEIIVINDGSTDQTLEVLQTFKTQINLFSTLNQGVSHARAFGLTKATGSYIQYLDSDDLLAPQKIRMQMQALKNKNGDVAYGDWQKFVEVNKNIIFKDKVSQEIDGDLETTIFAKFWAPPAALLYSKRICEKLSWSNTLPIIQDARYLLDAARSDGHFVYTPGVMAYYRTEQEYSLSQKSKLAFIKDIYQNSLEIHQCWLVSESYNQEKEKSIINSLRYTINEFRGLDRQCAKKAINALLTIAPGYIPEEKGLLRLMSKLFGYKQAEYLAYIKRKFLKG